MEHSRRFLFFLFSLLFLLSYRSLISAETADKARIVPLEFTVNLAGLEEPLNLDTFLEAALIFSGTELSSLESIAKKFETLISLAAETVGSLQDAREKAEQVLYFMHENVLTVYREEQTRLDVLISEGSYNCVSSAVLYMILVKSIGLEVWGIRTTDHAFSRISLGDEEIDVETTSPFGFNPGSKKEFKDHFGKVTGFSYVPPTNYSARRELDEKQTLALILYNRSAFLSERKQYAAAVGPAVDAYTLLRDDESYDRMIVTFLNLASWYGMKQNNIQALTFVSSVLDTLTGESRLHKLRRDLFHNRVIELIENDELDEAAILLEAELDAGQPWTIDKKEWKKLMIYIYQIKARREKDFEKAALLIKEALSKIGRDAGLLQSYEAYVHNRVVSLFNSGNYEKARLVLDNALIIAPDSARLRKDRSLIDSQMNNR